MPRPAPSLSLLAGFTVASIGAACSIAGMGNYRKVGAVSATIPNAGKLESIEIHNVAGTIDVQVADQGGARVDVDVDVLLEESRPETDFDGEFDSHVVMQQSGGRLTLRSTHVDDGDGDEWQLRFVVRVPAGVGVSIEQTAGNVDVRLPHARDVAVDTSAGRVTIVVPKVDGKVAVDARSGEIEVAVADSGPSDCELSCTAGSIALELPKDPNVDFDLAATAGDISLASRFGLATTREIASASARGRVGNGGARVRARVVSGQISVR